jgi:peroxiredoxin
MLFRRYLAAIVLLALSGLSYAGTSPLPTLAGKTERGGSVDLASYRGKVVLLYFWSTECAVCLDQLPEMRRNLNGWKGKDFQIIAVNQDDAMANLQAYEQVLDKVAPPSAQMQIVWRRDPAYRDSLGTLPVKKPTTLVINRDGTVAKRVTGRAAPEVWDDIAELVLNCSTCQ